MPYAVDIQTVEDTVEEIEKKLRACGYLRAIDIMRAAFSREVDAVHFTPNEETTTLHILSRDRICGK